MIVPPRPTITYCSGVVRSLTTPGGAPDDVPGTPDGVTPSVSSPIRPETGGRATAETRPPLLVDGPTTAVCEVAG